MPTFDVVSKVAMHEVDNAVQQTSKEITTRYDFRDTGASIERNDDGILLRANSEGRVEAAFSVLQEKLVRRKVSLRSLDPQKMADMCVAEAARISAWTRAAFSRSIRGTSIAAVAVS